MAPLKVLFTHYGDEWIRGSETVLLDLLRHINPSAVEPMVWCNGERLAAACRAEGYQTHCTPFSFYFDAGAPTFSASKYWALVREGQAIVRRYAPDVLHANSAAPTQWLLPVARSARLPLLTHLHISYLRRSRFAFLLHQADSIVGVCQDVVAGLRSDGLSEERIRVVYNGIDVDRMNRVPTRDLRQVLGIPTGAVVIGAVGSLIERKGHDLLIKALARLVNRLGMEGTAGPHLVLAGDGPARERLAALTIECGLNGRVHFAGYCDPVVDLYHAVDFIALATRGDALPLALLEAGLCEKPVVATRVGGIPEAVADGETGLLVPPEDIDSLAHALECLIAAPDLRAAMGAAARQRVQTLFSAERMVRSFEAEYTRLAAKTERSLGWSTTLGRLEPYVTLLTRLARGSTKRAVR